MFESGKEYRFVTVGYSLDFSQGTVEWSGSVKRFEHPLLELTDGKILNASSSHFISAEPTGRTAEEAGTMSDELPIIVHPSESQ
jgi:hypothetical protein